MRLLQGSLAAQPVAFLLWLLSDGSYPVLVAFAVTMGVAYGGFVALGPEALTASVLTVLLASRLPTRQVVDPADLGATG